MDPYVLPFSEVGADSVALVGGNKSGSGRGKTDTHVSSKKGGKKGGAASASRTAAERSASAKKAAATRKRIKEAKAGSK